MSITFEGYSEKEVLALSKEHLAVLVLSGEPIVLSVGSASILGSFRQVEDSFWVELAQIEGGGEGVLLGMLRLARKIALRFGCCKVEWIVYAVDCARPNLKLRRVLSRRGFSIAGSAYRLSENLTVAPASPGPS